MPPRPTARSPWRRGRGCWPPRRSPTRPAPRGLRALVVALRAAGWAARELYDHDAARRHLDEAVRAARSAGLDDLLAAALVTRSAVHLELGHEGAARRDLAAARDVARDGALAEVAFAEGLREDQVGDSPALRAYRRALDLAGEDHPHLRVKILNNLGVIAMRLGRHREAEQRLAAAEALATTLGPAVTALVTQSSALVAVEAGRPVEALRRYGRAEQLLRAADLPLMELHLDRAAALLSLQLLDEAADAADLAVEGYRRHDGGSLMLAEALVLQARIALAQDRPGPALAAAEQADDLFRRQRRAGGGPSRSCWRCARARAATRPVRCWPRWAGPRARWCACATGPPRSRPGCCTASWPPPPGTRAPRTRR